MHAAFSSVNFGLNVKPSCEKKSIDFFKSRPARLTKIFLVGIDSRAGLENSSVLVVQR